MRRSGQKTKNVTELALHEEQLNVNGYNLYVQKLTFTT